VFVAGSFWNRKVSTSLYRKDRTHVEDLKDLVEVQLPGGDRLLVVLRAEVPRDRIPFIPASPECLPRSYDREYLSGRFEMYVSGSTHNFNRFIASYTD